MPSTPTSVTSQPLSRQALHELVTWDGHPVVTSLFLDVDGRRFPRRSDLEPQIGELVRLAKEQAASLGPTVSAAVEADLAHVHAWLAEPLGRKDVRGVALFSIDRDRLWRALTLPTPVRPQVSIGPAPALAQLCEALRVGAPALAVLADGRGTRFLRMEQGRVDEHAGPVDEPGRRVDTDLELGSFDRLHEERVRRHLRRTAQAVETELRRWPAQRLVLGGPGEVVSVLEELLAPDAATLVVGRVTLPMASRAGDVADAARQVIEAFEEERRASLVDELRQRCERGAAGVAGVAGTLGAIGGRRVATLVVAPGFVAPGRRCPGCRRLVASPDEVACPDCGTSTEPLLDVIEAAVCAALRQEADVEICGGPTLDALGHIGAIERFPSVGTA
ncbi:MAG TPA: hypothetical protein VEI83_07605 [Acidimicrobiales bacterium]|nr:hypothetical protein [Acidimicrobiales bacterium]